MQRREVRNPSMWAPIFRVYLYGCVLFISFLDRPTHVKSSLTTSFYFEGKKHEKINQYMIAKSAIY